MFQTVCRSRVVHKDLTFSHEVRRVDLVSLYLGTEDRDTLRMTVLTYLDFRIVSRCRVPCILDKMKFLLF